MLSLRKGCYPPKILCRKVFLEVLLRYHESFMSSVSSKTVVPNADPIDSEGTPLKANALSIESSTPPAVNQSMLGATFLISAATLLSRMFGLVRDQLSAALLGAGFYGDAFNMAFRLPNLLRDLFAEGALSVAFQPVFVRQWQQGGIQTAYRLANIVITLLVCVVGMVVLMGILFASQLVHAWAPEFLLIPAKFLLTTDLTRLLMPFLLFVSVAAVLMAMLNAEQRFLWPALSSVFFNLAAIAMGVYILIAKPSDRRQITILWASATLLGGLLQCLVQIPPLYRAGYRFRPSFDFRFRDPGLRKILKTMLPMLIGLMPVQINIWVSSNFASSQDGAVTWLSNGFRLIQVFVGLFGVSIGTVALSRYSHSNHETSSQGLEEIRTTLRRSLRMVTLLCLPTSVGIWILAEPIIRILFQHGNFHAQDTIATAQVLRLYSIGLLSYVALKVTVPAFYAMGRSRIPVIGAFLGMAVNVQLIVTLFRFYGFPILALSVSISVLCNLIFLLACFHHFYGGLLQLHFWHVLAKMVGAALLMGLFLKGFTALYNWFWPGQHQFWKDLGFLGLATVLCLLVYGTLCAFMEVEEGKEMISKLRKRFGV